MEEPRQYLPHLKMIETQFPSDRTVQVEEVVFRQGLTVCICSETWRATAVFDQIYGFRVLDEYDLTEFWSEYTLKDGWLFEVTEDGWNSLELTRAHFISGRLNRIREFLIVGLNECVSVIAQEPPALTAAS